MIKKLHLMGLIILLLAGNVQAGKISFSIRNGNEQYALTQITNELGIPQYYFRDFEFIEDGQKLPYRIYWDLLGNYLQYELIQGNKLQKVNRKSFAEKDLQKLHEILLNENSEFKYTNYEKLSNTAAEKRYYEVDAVSGASKSAANIDFVNNAIKISCIFWKSAYGDTRNQIIKLTDSYFEKYLMELNNIDEKNVTLLKDKLSGKDEKQKTAYLYSLWKTKNNGKKVLAENFNEHLNNLNGAAYALALNILQKDKQAIANETIIKKMSDNSKLNFCLTYNFCILNRKKSLLKNTTPLQFLNRTWQ